MLNIELYNQAYIKSLRVNADQLDKLSYRSVSAWNSMGHMELIAALEKAFNIILDTNDIIDISSYENGKPILKKYNITF